MTEEQQEEVRDDTRVLKWGMTSVAVLTVIVLIFLGLRTDINVSVLIGVGLAVMGVGVVIWFGADILEYFKSRSKNIEEKIAPLQTQEKVNERIDKLILEEYANVVKTKGDMKVNTYGGEKIGYHVIHTLYKSENTKKAHVFINLQQPSYPLSIIWDDGRSEIKKEIREAVLNLSTKKEKAPAQDKIVAVDPVTGKPVYQQTRTLTEPDKKPQGDLK